MSTRYEYKEYPKTLYRVDADGKRISRLFNSAEEVEEGWVDLAGMPVSPVAYVQVEQAMPKRYRQLEDENARLLDSVKFLTDENERLQRELDALKAPEGEAETSPETPKPARKRKAQA